MNQEITSHGDFLTLDRVHKQLILPRFKLSISGKDIREFIEVHGWHTEKDQSGPSSEWLRELSVLVQSDEGGFFRYPVITSGGGNVSRWARELAEFFGVKLRVIKLTRRECRRVRHSRV
jgi:hypothetical protein